MRSSLKLINVLVAAALFAIPLTVVSAQTGTDGYDAYYNHAAAGATAPTALPWMGERTGTLGDAYADASVDPATSGLAPGFLPVTGSSFDEASALRDAYADLRATGQLEPAFLPVTGALDRNSLPPDVGPYDFAWLDAAGVEEFEPTALPVTGQGVSGLSDLDVIANELAVSGFVLGSASEPALLPQTGLDASALPDDLRFELAASGVDIGAASVAPAALPTTGADPDWVPYGLGFGARPESEIVASAPLALPVTGFIWSDDLPYITGDTQAFNDSGASAASNAPATLPVTGGDRLDVVGGR